MAMSLLAGRCCYRAEDVVRSTVMHAFVVVVFLYISSLVLLRSPVALSVFSFSPFGPFSLTSFSLNLHFPKGIRLFCVALVFLFV